MTSAMTGTMTGVVTEVPTAVRVLLPPGSVLLGPGADAIADLTGVGPAGRVGLADGRPGSRSRLRRRAARLGLEIQAEYVVLPGWRHPTFIVEDDPDTLGWLFTNLATVPPNLTRWAWLADVAARVVGTSWGRAVAARLVPGRLLVGAAR